MKKRCTYCGTEVSSDSSLFFVNRLVYLCDSDECDKDLAEDIRCAMEDDRERMNDEFNDRWYN